MKAPSVTQEALEANIHSTEIVKYITASGQILRWAVLIVANGYAVTGDPSAAVCPENDDPALGEYYAIENAKKKLWQMMGYALKEKVAMVAAATPPSKSNMETFVGTKVVHAVPMDRLSYNLFRGWTLPDDENGDDEGYLVEYGDGGQANVEGYAGYISWSPKDVFERAYGKL